MYFLLFRPLYLKGLFPTPKKNQLLLYKRPYRWLNNKDVDLWLIHPSRIYANIQWTLIQVSHPGKLHASSKKRTFLIIYICTRQARAYDIVLQVQGGKF